MNQFLKDLPSLIRRGIVFAAKWASRNRLWLGLAVIGGGYLLFVLAILAATAVYSTPGDLWAAMNSQEIRFAVLLSFTTCTISALLALLVAVPTGYLLSRKKLFGKSVIEAALDIPIFLPPMVIGLCLLIFFQTHIGRWIEDETVGFTYTVYGIVLAQWVIGSAFAIRTMRGTFEHLSARPEQVAMTLGCSNFGAFWHVALPSAGRGMVSAVTIAWARSLGEFGPILVFAGATRMKTEVLPTTVWLELSVGNLEAAVAVSVLLVGLAFAVLALVRWVGGGLNP